MWVSMRCCMEGGSTSMYHGVWLQRPTPRLAGDTSLNVVVESNMLVREAILIEHSALISPVASRYFLPPP